MASVFSLLMMTMTIRLISHFSFCGSRRWRQRGRHQSKIGEMKSLGRAHFCILRPGTWNVTRLFVWILPRANDECHFWLIDLQESKCRMSRRRVDRLEAFRIAWVGRNSNCCQLFIYISVDLIRFFLSLQCKCNHKFDFPAEKLIIIMWNWTIISTRPKSGKQGKYSNINIVHAHAHHTRDTFYIYWIGMRQHPSSQQPLAPNQPYFPLTQK